MAKDSYWFKHDSTSGRGIRMRKMAHIYGHWGKGIYWDVIEILRDQSEYSFESDTSSLQLLADLIGCKDEEKFISWMRDCVHIDLFKMKDGKFYSEVLCENMKNWDVLKQNGSKGGRPNKPKNNQTHNQTHNQDNNHSVKQNETIREEKSIEDKKEVFNEIPCLVDQETFDSIKQYFGFENSKYYNQWKLINIFIGEIQRSGQLADFKEAFKYYKLFKEKSKQMKHSFKSFVEPDETTGEYVWKMENWKAKYESLNGVEKPFTLSGWGKKSINQ